MKEDQVDVSLRQLKIKAHNINFHMYVLGYVRKAIARAQALHAHPQRALTRLALQHILIIKIKSTGKARGPIRTISFRGRNIIITPDVSLYAQSVPPVTALDCCQEFHALPAMSTAANTA